MPLPKELKKKKKQFLESTNLDSCKRITTPLPESSGKKSFISDLSYLNKLIWKERIKF